MTEELQERLIRLLEGTADYDGLTGLIHIARSMTEAYIRHLRPSVQQLSNRQGMSVTDLAYDCIADAFYRSDTGSFPKMEAFARSLRAPIREMPPEETWRAFAGFMTRIADAEIGRLYAQNDPTASKIHRNIRDTIRRTDTFALIRDFRGCVVMVAGAEDSERLPEFPIPELSQVFLNRIDGNRMIPGLLASLHSSLSDQHRYRQSVTLIDVVNLFREVIVLHDEVGEPSVTEHEGLMPHELDSIRRNVERVLREKIVVTYLSRGKLDRPQAEAVANVLSDIIDIWCEERGEDFSLSALFIRYYPVSQQDYESTFRAKLEYLLKIARDEFASRLERDI